MMIIYASKRPGQTSAQRARESLESEVPSLYLERVLALEGTEAYGALVEECNRAICCYSSMQQQMSAHERTGDSAFDLRLDAVEELLANYYRISIFAGLLYHLMPKAAKAITDVIWHYRVNRHAMAGPGPVRPFETKGLEAFAPDNLYRDFSAYYYWSLDPANAVPLPRKDPIYPNLGTAAYMERVSGTY